MIWLITYPQPWVSFSLWNKETKITHRRCSFPSKMWRKTKWIEWRRSPCIDCNNLYNEWLWWYSFKTCLDQQQWCQRKRRSLSCSHEVLTHNWEKRARLEKRTLFSSVAQKASKRRNLNKIFIVLCCPIHFEFQRKQNPFIPLRN